MIQSLRQKHRVIIFALALVLPILFALSLFVRKPMPVNHQLPALNSSIGNAR